MAGYGFLQQIPHPLLGPLGGMKRPYPLSLVRAWVARWEVSVATSGYQRGLRNTSTRCHRSHQGPRLDDDKRQQTMDSDFPSAPYRNVVETSKPFQSPKETLNPSTEVVKVLPIRSLNNTSDGFLMGSIDLNDRFPSVLSSNQAAEGITGITSIGHHIQRVELAVSLPGLTEERGSHFHISHIALGDVNRYRKLMGNIAKDVSLIAEHKFLLSSSVLFHTPTCVRVTRGYLPTVGPSLEVRSVDSHQLAKVGEGVITLESQGTHDILDGHQVPGPSQLTHEARVSKGRRDSFKVRDAARFSEVRVILQHPDKSGKGGNVQVIHGDEGMPEDCMGISTSSGVVRFEGGKQSRIRNSSKQGLKPVAECGIIRSAGVLRHCCVPSRVPLELLARLGQRFPELRVEPEGFEPSLNSFPGYCLYQLGYGSMRLTIGGDWATKLDLADCLLSGLTYHHPSPVTASLNLAFSSEQCAMNHSTWIPVSELEFHFGQCFLKLFNSHRAIRRQRWGLEKWLGYV